MITRYILAATLAVAPVWAASSQPQAVDPREVLRSPPSNVAGTTPQQIERRPTLRERAAAARERARARLRRDGR
jgi:hypothetical protein